jgi:hypothetical protein
LEDLRGTDSRSVLGLKVKSPPPLPAWRELPWDPAISTDATLAFAAERSCPERPGTIPWAPGIASGRFQVVAEVDIQ